MDASLVKLVEHDGAKVGKQRIALQPRGQDAFGSDEEPGLGAEAAFETHVPANLASNRPAALGGDVLGDGAGGHRLGSRTMTGPSGTRAGGTRVVLPAPGGAVTTTARDPFKAS